MASAPAHRARDFPFGHFYIFVLTNKGKKHNSNTLQVAVRPQKSAFFRVVRLIRVAILPGKVYASHFLLFLIIKINLVELLPLVVIESTFDQIPSPVHVQVEIFV